MTGWWRWFRATDRSTLCAMVTNRWSQFRVWDYAYSGARRQAMRSWTRTMHTAREACGPGSAAGAGGPAGSATGCAGGGSAGGAGPTAMGRARLGAARQRRIAGTADRTGSAHRPLTASPLPLLALQSRMSWLNYTPSEAEIVALNVGNDRLEPLDERTEQMKRRDAQPPESLLSKLRFLLLCVRRTLFLFALAAPLVLSAPLFFYLLPDRQRVYWYRALRLAIERAGCAAIKIAQWLSHRQDFVADVRLCHELRRLRSDAPAHSAAVTRAVLQRALGVEPERVFAVLEPQPVASGSVAQVHRAVLRPDAPGAPQLRVQRWREAALRRRGRMGLAERLLVPLLNAFTARPALSEPSASAPPSPHAQAQMPTPAETEAVSVAVKVRHPGVAAVLRADLALFEFWTALLGRLPGLRGLRVPVALREFADSLQSQVDLRVEAHNLERFHANFARRPLAVVFPQPVLPLSSEAVLVESWEPGVSVQVAIDQPGPHNERLARLGYATFMHQLLVDDFVHADAHAGNILYRPTPDGSVELVVLDAGLVTELTPAAERHFRSLLLDVATGDATHCADSFLQLSERRPSPAQQEAFRQGMRELFRQRVEPAGGAHAFLLHGASLRAVQNARNPPLNVGLLVNDMMGLVRQHGLQLESEFAFIIIAITVLEGLARGLDPTIDLVGGMAPFFVGELRHRAQSALRRAANLVPSP